MVALLLLIVGAAALIGGTALLFPWPAVLVVAGVLALAAGADLSRSR